MALVLLTAAVLKACRPRGTAIALGAWVPKRRVWPLVFLLMGTEATIGASLLAPIKSAWILLPPALLLVLFTGILAAAARRETRVSCACFGASSRTPPVAAIVRNVVLLGLLAGASTADTGGLDLRFLAPAIQLSLLVLIPTEAYGLVLQLRHLADVE